MQRSDQCDMPPPAHSYMHMPHPVGRLRRPAVTPIQRQPVNPPSWRYVPFDWPLRSAAPANQVRSLNDWRKSGILQAFWASSFPGCLPGFLPLCSAEVTTRRPAPSASAFWPPLRGGRLEPAEPRCRLGMRKLVASRQFQLRGRGDASLRFSWRLVSVPSSSRGARASDPLGSLRRGCVFVSSPPPTTTSRVPAPDVADARPSRAPTGSARWNAAACFSRQSSPIRPGGRPGGLRSQSP